MKHFIYKICAKQAWDEACRNGHFDGSADDRRDGFIHLSTARQLSGTLAKHFAGQTGLVLIEFDPRALAAALRWETSAGGHTYPHLYADLPTSAAVSVRDLPLRPDGGHALPEELSS